MRLARILGVVGRVLITAGTLILLFVAYQLWGTGIREAQSQNRLEDEYEAFLDDVDSPDGGGGTTTTTKPDEPGDAPDKPRIGDVPIPPEGNPIAHLRIPAISVDKYVVQGVSLDDLQLGPGHYPETPMPGQEGNAAVAGHRTTYGAPFNRLDELQKGDKIFVDTWYGNFRYDVHAADESAEFAYQVVDPYQTEVLADFGDNRITLTACHPEYSAAQRIVIVAKMYEGGKQKAVPYVPSEQDKVDTEKRLEKDIGDTGEARWPAIAWGLLCAAIWIAAWLIGRWWGHKWPAYFIGLPFFLVALFFFFEEFSRLLPSNY